MTNALSSDQSSSRSVRSFVYKHNRDLVVVGAILIFLTFLVREAIRERLRELVDSISSAELSVSIDESIAVPMLRFDRVDQQLREINERIGDLTDDVHQLEGEGKALAKARQTHRTTTLIVSPSQRDVQDQIDDRLNFMEVQSMLAFGSLQHAQLLTNKMGKSAKYSKDIDSYWSQAECVEDGLKRIRWDRSTTLIAVDKFRHDNQETAEKIRDFEEEVLAAAKAQGDTDELWYRRFTWLSYGLYMLGWGLALIGRLYGVEGLAEAA